MRKVLENDEDMGPYFQLGEALWKCGKTSLRDKFPLLYKAAEELDVECFLSENDLALLDRTLTGNMSEEEFKRCKKGLETSIFMNEVAHSKRTFAKLASTGFCVTQRGEIVFAEGTGTVRHEETTVTGKKGETLIKCKSIVKPPEVMIKNRVRKSMDEGQGSIGTTTKTTVSVKVQQQAKLSTEPAKPPTAKKSEDPSSIQMSKVVDVDALVELIEGTHIKTSDPKKAAKKARQKEKKEMERQRQADEEAKEERKKRQEELKQLELERKREAEAKRRLEAEERKRQDEIIRKQKEAAEQKKEEQRRKRDEVERRKADEKKLKKDAKKQRREQRKKELEGPEENDHEVETKTVPNRHEPIAKTEPKKGREDKEAKKAAEIASEKDFGRIKHEKEQRKREEEEARRLEQVQAQERAQANKKNKKKKKKQKHNSESNSQSASDASGQGSQNGSSQTPETSENTTAPAGAPILDLINANNSDAQGKTGDGNNLVTIKKHMDSTVTISMKGKEGEKDLIYTLMNGQVYPTNNDGRIRAEEALPLQNTAFVKPETVRANHIHTPPATISSGCYPYANPVKTMGYPGHSHSVASYPTPVVPDNSGMGEIDLSQLKLPPGITITKVPQHLSGMRGDDMNGIQNAEFQQKPMQSSMNDYARISSMSGMDARYNPNVMVVDSRCSSLESPVIGIRPSDTMYGANGTRPSSEASVTSDRPNSGMDSLGHNGINPYVTRPGFHSNEMLHARVPMSLSSPFASASRNETPSPGWPNDYNPHVNGMPGMIPSTSGVRQDGQGFWSSTPASPVAFPPNSVSEILKAQDQQFKFRGVGYGLVGDGTSPSGYAPDAAMLAHKAAQYKQGVSASVNPASYAVGQPTMNGSSSPRGNPYCNSGGYRDVPIPPQQRTYDQWSPWDPPLETSSPDASASPSSTSQSSPLMKPPQMNGDNGVSWESAHRQAQDKQTGNRTVNPYGPIGSNISRRSSSDASNGISQNGKPPGPPRTNDSAFWSYNRTF
ncbi:Reticulocyte-binding protein 2 a [Orchesella cincta]|uniref:Reticulocyte-binding protein 2 a n=1 Tax=Orchesella cincta TaxID=48709 RepID=A0A1D2N3R5_ORCCI|nr:Reticulocyte-binding protein 2 a [Orchesella cincta]